MGQKMHPLGLRLGITTFCRERWIVRSNLFRQRWLVEDKAMRDYLQETFKEAHIKHIVFLRQEPFLTDRNTSRSVNVIDVKIFAVQPWKICPTTNQKLMLQLSKTLAKICQEKRIPGMWLGRPDFRIFLDFYKLNAKKQQHHAYRIATELIQKLEDREPFRKALKEVIRSLQVGGHKRFPKRLKKNLAFLKGVRIQLSGRLNGAEIARVEWYKQGRVPLQTLRARVDYVSKTAKTTHGVLGIKVWTFKGEKKVKKKKPSLPK